MTTYETTKLKVIHEQGVREGIRFACGIFLGNLPPSIEEELYQKTVDFLIIKYYSELKDLTQGSYQASI